MPGSSRGRARHSASASLALLHAAFPDRAARARAVGVWGGIAGLAAAAGPVLGGVLVGQAGWRLVFYVNVPIAVAAMILTHRHVPAPRPAPAGWIRWPSAWEPSRSPR
nr:MFS transporter [Streptomyces sp. NRRL F-5135]